MGEHHEVGGTFSFSASNFVRAGQPSLIRYQLRNHDLGNFVFEEGSGYNFNYTFEPEDKGFVSIRIYADANDNHSCDLGEDFWSSLEFSVERNRVIDVSVAVSDVLGSGAYTYITAEIQRILDEEAAIALARDSADDWRAWVEFNVTSIRDFHGGDPGWPDKIVSDTEFAQLGKQGESPCVRP